MPCLNLCTRGTNLFSPNKDVRPKGDPLHEKQEYWDPIEDLRWVNPGLFTGVPPTQLVLVCDKWWVPQENVGGEVFAQEPRANAHKACRGGSGLCIYLCHTHSKEEACCQGCYLPLLLYSELPPAKTPKNAKASPSECAFVFLCFEVSW